MATFRASTQFNDEVGTASITWHADNKLDEFARCIGIPEGFFPISISVNWAFPYNRTDPIEDVHKKPVVQVKVVALKDGEWSGENIPTFLQNAEPSEIRLH